MILSFKLLCKIKFQNVFCHRPYTVSDMSMYKNVGYDFCEAKGLGLALWSDHESYEDMKYLGILMYNHSGITSFDTALNNENQQSCDTNLNQSCDGKLIWRQTKNGPCEIFQAHAGHQR